MNILIIAGISVTVGVLLGVLVVWLIYLQRRDRAVDSLIRINNLVGISGIVEIPFDDKSQGKVRVNVKGSMVDLVAFTDEPFGFRSGDRIFIVEVKGNQVWVVAQL